MSAAHPITTPTFVAGQPYAALCSIPLSAALAIIVSSVDLPAAPNPFRCDFIQLLWSVCKQVHPRRYGPRLFGDDPRPYSYCTLALYRLLRHLIPHTDAIATAAEQRASDAPPDSSASMDVALAVMERRIREVFTGTGAVQEHALRECDKTARNVGDEPVFTVEEAVQPLLTVDAADDEQQLSAWQRWLVGSEAWQRLAGTTLEYVAAELMELLDNEVRRAFDVLEAARDDERGNDEGEASWPFNRIACLHEKVLANDPELANLWRSVGMPADCPPGVDIDLHTAYKQQFEQWMRAAVKASAPWMFHVQQVEQRVGEWMAGRLPSGDPLFFRRYHIRPLWHSIMDGPKLRVESGAPRLDFPVKAGFDLVDAAGVSRPIVVHCAIDTDDGTFGVHVIEAVGNTTLLRYRFDGATRRSNLCFANGVLGTGKEEGRDSQPFDDYLCHGHLHGLSEQQWDEAVGRRFRVYYYSADAAESEQERQDDEQAAKSREGLFPARLEDVTYRWRYRSLQRAEIRRMAAIATRLSMLDADVDVAVFPCFQPVAMRRRFEAAVQPRLEVEVARLPEPLPRVLQGIVMGYHTSHIDVPL